MSFPWKKNKVKRISQLFAGLHSPKRGGSLVVETGFPTSLIDLVVKNRERFEKTRTKKPVRVQVLDPVFQDAPPPPPPPSPTTLFSLNENCLVVSTVDDQIVRTESESFKRRDGDSDFDGGVSVKDQNHVEESGSGTDPVLVSVAVLKMVIVVVFTLSTKKLTVEITTLAFLLLFLEYVVRRFCCYLNPSYKPSSDSKKWMKSLEHAVSNFFCLINSVMPWKRTETCESEFIPYQSAVDSNSSISEIEVLETLKVVETEVKENVGFEKICNVGNEINLNDRDKAVDCLETESEGIVLEECEHCASRNKLKLNAKLNSKQIKKFVLKKWRSTKKERKNKEKETPESSSPDVISVGDDKSGKTDKEQEETGHKARDDGTKLPFFEIGEYCNEQKRKENHGIACSNGLLLQTTKEADGNYRKQRNSGIAIPFLIVLVGLLLGRALAMLLIMAWCVVLKFGEKEERSKNSPLVMLKQR